jgi:predicted alpha/beta superfamily hydrolase
MKWTLHAVMLLLAAIILSGCATGAARRPVTEIPMKRATAKVRLVALVPADSPRVFVAGNHESLGNWNPGARALEGSGLVRSLTVEVPLGFPMEFKFTAGSWQTEALGLDDQPFENIRLLADADREAVYTVTGFKRGYDPLLETLGDAKIEADEVVVWRDFPSRFGIRPRHVMVRLPVGYHRSNRRYPVLYMHDGQNVFDPRMTNMGVDWGADELAERLARERKIGPMIIVAAFSTDERMLEYSPFDLGAAYGRFLAEELKPRVDAEFRTLPEREHTALMGSSMGGLISFFVASRHSEVFGLAGCVSTHFIWEEGRTVEALRRTGAYPRDVRLWFDYGTEGIDSEYEPLQDEVTALLESWGWEQPRDFVVRKYEGADHNEAAWRERLEDPFVYLFGGWK